MQFLDDIIAENKQNKAKVVEINSDIQLRCTYCQPTICFKSLEDLKKHMITIHKTPLIFAEHDPEIQERTLQFHRDFYNSTGKYKDEVTYKMCKCANMPAKTTKSELYLHSIEASHYPLIACQRCGVLMEREDSHEHALANCNPQREGAIFL